MSLPSYITVTLLLLGSVRADNSTEADSCDVEPWGVGPWSAALEEWAVAAPVDSERQGRVMSLPPAPGYYVSDRVDRPPPGPDGPVPYSEWQPPSGPGKIVNRPTQQPYKDKPFRPSAAYPGPNPPNHLQQYPPPNNHYPQNPNHGPEYVPQRIPEYPHQNPGNPHQNHGNPHQNPGNPHQNPGNPHQNPSNLHQNPSNPHQNPGNSHQNTGNPHQNTGNTHQNPGNPHRGPGPIPSQTTIDRVDDPPKKQVTETDLYLLSAIEKLVYRVDLMEKRLRKLEENVLYLASGVDKYKPESCVANFTRVGGICYHFSAEPVDWKSANLHCRKLRANLIELDTDDERRHMFHAMLGDKRIRGLDVWTGGLNPGLLWIWSHSARPILANSTTVAGAASSTSTDVTIQGAGRCLALVHDSATNTYVYRGQDCALRHRYICEKEEDKARLSNEIEKVSRSLEHTAATARQARLLLADRIDPSKL